MICSFRFFNELFLFLIFIHLRKEGRERAHAAMLWVTHRCWTSQDLSRQAWPAHSLEHWGVEQQMGGLSLSVSFPLCVLFRQVKLCDVLIKKEKL